MQAMIYDRRYLGYILLLPLILLASPEILERFTDLEQGNVNENYAKLNSYAWRELLWQTGLAWAAERPVLGYGLESFSYHVAEFFPVPLGDAGTTDAHSVFVQLIFETGAVGLAAYAWSFILVLVRLVRWTRDNSAAGIFIGLVAAYLAMAYADNLLYYLTPNWYFWFVLGSFFAVAERRSSAHKAAAGLMRGRLRSVPVFAPKTPG
jgi:O-antigen ligase